MALTNGGIKGNAGLVFTIAQGVNPAVAYDGDVKNVRIVTEDRDDADLTFAEAAAGAVKDFRINVTAVQDTATGSLWRLLWDNPGATFTIVYGPNGNATASAAKPHFRFTAKATGQPEVGGEAARTGGRFDFEYVFEATSAPTLVTA